MKDRIVIEDKYGNNKIYYPEYREEQIPETFEELKELCKNLDYIRFGKAGETQDTEYIALDNKLYFYKNGTIDFGFDNLAYDITFAKMWIIIKSLL